MSNSFECRECGTKRRKQDVYTLELYDTPWDVKPRIEYVCKETPANVKKAFMKEYRRSTDSCEELLTDTSWADFRYFECAWCYRTICEQNPRNGWHTQYRYVNDCEQVCLKCYEAELLEHGLENEREKLESGQLAGMFFNDSELTEHGYTKASDEFVRGTKEAKTICERVLSLMKDYRVVINYESLGLGGGEGYISIWQADKGGEG